MQLNMDARILVADDSNAVRVFLKGILEEIGFRAIETAGNGRAALDKLLSDSYDLVLSDWNMPVMTGLELLRIVRNSAKPLSDIPFIMITAEAEESQVLSAIENKVDSYIVKPFTTDTVEQRIVVAARKKPAFLLRDKA